jgi:nitrogen regulatory protein PII
MKSADLSALSVAELLERFAAICVEQNKTLFSGGYAKFNRLFDQMVAVENELKIRPGDQRSALLALFDHPDMQVRLQAAKLTLAVAPEAARQMLERIKEWRRQPQAGDAGMCLINLDRGIFVPK